MQHRSVAKFPLALVVFVLAVMAMAGLARIATAILVPMLVPHVVIIIIMNS